MAGLGGYALAAIVSYFSPGAAMTLYGLIAFYYFFEHLPSTGKAEPDVASDP